MHTPTTNTTDDRRPHVHYVIRLGVEDVGLTVGGCGFGTQGLGFRFILTTVMSFNDGMKRQGLGEYSYISDGGMRD